MRRHRRNPQAVEDEIAGNVEGWVRDAWHKTLRGMKERTTGLERIVVSAWGRKYAEWLVKEGVVERTPFKVLILNEAQGGGTAIIPDAMSHRDWYEAYDRVAALLRRNPWVEDAGWESANAAVSYFWIRPRIVS